MQLSNFQLDWLSFTYLDASSENLLDDFFNLFPEFNNYKQSMVLCHGKFYQHGLLMDDDIMIRYDDDNRNKGVNVSIPSHGLETFFKLFEGKTVKEVIQILDSRGCKPSRIDVCFDDYTKKYRPRYYFRKFDKGLLNTRMHQVQLILSPDGVGETFYIGSRRKKMVRIYDKFAESGGEIDAIRYEIEMHGNSAYSFWYYLIHSGFERDLVYFGDLLLDVFKVVKPNPNDKTKSRWKVNEQWLDFVKSTFSQRCISIPTYKPEWRVKKVEEWAKNTCFPTMAFLASLYGYDWLKHELMECALTEKQQAFLQYMRCKWYEQQDYYDRLFMI